ncbi:MAG: SPOR domain-containing protein [Spirochaetales bacterium]|nr:SPOR domain-containing protein [Spirochaetales bacterium]
MERNRVLWVIFSISLFLVVVLAGGLYLLRPVSAEDTEVAAGRSSQPRGFDVFEYVRGKSEPPALEEEPEEAEELVIIVGEREEAPPEEPAAAPEPPEKAVQPVPESRPSGEAPAATPRTSRPAAAVQERPPAVPAAPRPAPAAAKSPAAAAPTRPATRSDTRPREVSITEYWIQAGSYTSPSRAQEVAAVLEDQGLVSKITTRSLNEKTHYRVRIGPYMSKAEAEKFLEWVKAVKGFESSYISMVYAKRRNQ